jgi:hypothetical protein
MSVAIAQVNNALRRNIKSGLQYNKYFPKAACKASQLGSGDTTYTLQLMKQQVVDFIDQTKLIAPILEKRTVPETIKSVYDFAFNHFQYSADGYEQQLRSPACSWASRKMGIDCKSYSLLCASILLNLKIPNIKFRKITQPNSPDTWSHVYLVVDHQGKELVIDATKKINTEPEKVKYFDMSINLPHIGLNGDSETVVLSERDINMMQSINFLKNEFFPYLRQLGVLENTINSIFDEVRTNIELGIKPTIEITNTGVLVGSVHFPLTITNEGLQGLGFWSAIASTVVGGAGGGALDMSNLFNFSDPDSIGGKLNDLWGSFTGTSAAVFAGEGNTWVNDAKKNLEAGVKSNPSLALSTYAKKLAEGVIEFQYRLENSSQTKTKVGNTTSRDEVQAALNDLPKLEQKLSAGYGIKKQTRSEQVQHATLKKLGPKTLTYFEYQLTEKFSSKGGNSANGLDLGLQYNKSTFKSGTSSFMSSLINLTSGLMQDPKTGQVYTPEEAQIIQDSQITSSSSGSSKTPLIILGVSGALILGALYAKKQNLI